LLIVQLCCSWKRKLSSGNTGNTATYLGLFLFVIELQTDANISSTNNNTQTKAKDPKKYSHRSTYDQTSVKLVMAGTGCSDAAVAEHV
jgi:hypothetical protein